MSVSTAELPMQVGAFIDGVENRLSGARCYRRENPARIDEVVTEADEGDAGVTEHAIAVARSAFDGNVKGWVTNHRLREQVLMRVGALIRKNAESLARAVSLEVGMPMRQATIHVSAAADVFDFYAGYATKLYGEAMFLPNGAFMSLLKEPVGVVGMILPWNFPLTQAARKVAPAMAAGCTMVLKPASFTAASTMALVRLLHEAGVPAGVVNCVSGPGTTVGNVLVEHPHVDKLSFTGSTGVGTAVLQRAAATMKRVSLELGGKNPFILMEDGDLETAANALVFGMFRNAGQACGATSRLLVQQDVKAAFLEKVLARVAALRVGAPAHTSTDMGPVISRKQEEVTLGYIEGARASGARLLCGGNKLQGPDFDRGYFVAPTLFDDVDPASALAREEVFGPVLAILSFKTEEEAVRMANDSTFGLTASVFTSNSGRGMRMARAIQAGTVWLGDAYTQPVEGIWGGYKQSGLGRELGPYGLLDFVEVKQIYTDNSGQAMKPHYAQVLNPSAGS